MSALTPGARAFLAQGMFAHIVTLGCSPTGARTCPSPGRAWTATASSQATFSDQRKIENLRRDPRIAMSFLAHESGGELLHPYLVVQGRATISEGGAMAVMDHLAPTYLGEGAVFPLRNMPAGLTVRVEVDKVYGQGAWKRGDAVEELSGPSIPQAPIRAEQASPSVRAQARRCAAVSQPLPALREPAQYASRSSGLGDVRSRRGGSSPAGR
ncbi:MAG: pyridoxamine 5'-phosphate oxidase family protein [Chloroflexota bacterium]